MSKQKKFKEIKDEFLNFIKDKTLVIHNAEFDLSHLNNELLLIGDKAISNKIIDTLNLARTKFPGSQNSLDALCKRYKIDISMREKHNALLDCSLLAKVYINLIDQKEPMLNFENNENVHIQENKDKNYYYKKIILPSEKEVENHKNYLKLNLKKNYFN